MHTEIEEGLFSLANDMSKKGYSAEMMTDKRNWRNVGQRQEDLYFIYIYNVISTNLDVAVN